MKGMELPINTMVLLAAAIVVLLAVGGLFFVTYVPGGSGLGVQAQFRAACLSWDCSSEFGNCDVAKQALGITDCSSEKDKIKSSCGCPVVSTQPPIIQPQPQQPPIQPVSTTCTKISGQTCIKDSTNADECCKTGKCTGGDDFTSVNQKDIISYRCI